MTREQVQMTDAWNAGRVDEARTRLRDVQKDCFGAIVSDERQWHDVDEAYMPGTIDDVQGKALARFDATVEYLMLATLTADVEQLDLSAKHIVEPFGDLI